MCHAINIPQSKTKETKMNFVSTIIASIMSVTIMAASPVTAQISDREAAALALGAAAIIAGTAIASQNRRRDRHHHHYHPVPVYPQRYYHPAPVYSHPPSLRYRYYEPMPAPSPYYHHPHRRHW